MDILPLWGDSLCQLRRNMTGYSKTVEPLHHSESSFSPSWLGSQTLTEKKYPPKAKPTKLPKRSWFFRPCGWSLKRLRVRFKVSLSPCLNSIHWLTYSALSSCTQPVEEAPKRHRPDRSSPRTLGRGLDGYGFSAGLVQIFERTSKRKFG
jgi:hypothetical protein